ncbi:MAG: ATP-binding protein [Burkholderiaceae bacterium]
MVLQHHPFFVALSLVAVIFSATTASIVSVRAGRNEHGRMRTWWYVGAAVSLAAGIWSMHFIGMVAMQFPFPVRFQPELTVASFLPALAAGLGLVAMARRGRTAWPSQGVIFGLTALGVVAMHYTAMAGIEFSPGTLADTGQTATPGSLDQRLSGPFDQYAGPAMPILILLVTANLIGIAVSVFDQRLEDTQRKRADDLALTNRQLGSRARQLSHELAREKTVFEAAVDATQDCIWSWQPDTQELFLSSHLHGLLGTDPHYSMATIEELEVRLHREDRPEFRKAFQAAVADPFGQIRLKARLRQSDGGWRWVLFRARMVSRPKAPTMLVGAISDIQALQHAEEEARQLAEQQREIAHLRSRIVRILSHELRTPLAVVTTSADLLASIAQARSDDQKARLDRYFGNIHQAMHKIESILNDALQFNRLETGDRIVSFNWVAPVALVEEAVRWACDGEKKPRAQVEIRDHGFQGEVQSDARLLELVLRNLLTNALKYGQDKPVTVEFLTDDDRVCIDFIDNGMGIPESQQVQLFRAFFRGNNVGALPGTGLGLSIARRAAEACGGELMLVTSSPQGSRFRLILHGSPRRTIAVPRT